MWRGCSREKILTNCKQNTEVASEGRKPLERVRSVGLYKFVEESSVKNNQSAKRRAVQIEHYYILQICNECEVEDRVRENWLSYVFCNTI